MSFVNNTETISRLDPIALKKIYPHINNFQPYFISFQLMHMPLYNPKWFELVNMLTRSAEYHVFHFSRIDASITSKRLLNVFRDNPELTGYVRIAGLLCVSDFIPQKCGVTTKEIFHAKNNNVAFWLTVLLLADPSLGSQGAKWLAANLKRILLFSDELNPEWFALSAFMIRKKRDNVFLILEPVFKELAQSIDVVWRPRYIEHLVDIVGSRNVVVPHV